MDHPQFLHSEFSHIKQKELFVRRELMIWGVSKIPSGSQATPTEVGV